MQNIVPDVLGLEQYLTTQKEMPGIFRPSTCPNCGKAGLHCHGYYDRKVDRDSGVNNPVHISRFFCPFCHKTCSVLPECISPHRWYLWRIQQSAIILVLAGKSLAAIAKEVVPSRHTISRWLGHLKERFKFHKDVMCQHFIDLGRTDSFADFWSACLSKIPLSKAMLFCNAAGVNIP